MEISIPEDVRRWIHGVFRACNVQTAGALMQMPSTHEASLDSAFVAKAAEFSAPVKFPSEWVVRIDTHFLGGRRHFNGWEIADIGILIMFRRGGKLLRSKVALLQSKRLYPVEEAYEEDERIDYEMGFGRLFRGDTSFASVTAPRIFAFGDESRYQALKVGDHQYEAVKEYETQYGIPIYYMLYHPGRIPFQTEIPRLASAPSDSDVEVGARIVPATALRDVLSEKADNYVPYYRDIRGISLQPQATTRTPPGWLVEEFLAELALDCKVGHIAKKERDSGLNMVFNRRAGPISAAIAVTFDAPAKG